MIAYFGENEKDNIEYILRNLFCGCDFSDAKLTDNIWEEDLKPADYVVAAFQKRGLKKKK